MQADFTIMFYYELPTAISLLLIEVIMQLTSLQAEEDLYKHGTAIATLHACPIYLFLAHWASRARCYRCPQSLLKPAPLLPSDFHLVGSELCWVKETLAQTSHSLLAPGFWLKGWCVQSFEIRCCNAARSYVQGRQRFFSLHQVNKQ